MQFNHDQLQPRNIPEPLFSEKEGIVKYEIKRKIGDLTYSIELSSKQDDLHTWEVGFHTVEYGEAITNQGMAAFNEIVDAIAELTATVQKKQKIDSIQFSASHRSESVENIKKIEDSLRLLYTNNHEAFDGFHYEDERTNFDIQKGKITFKVQRVAIERDAEDVSFLTQRLYQDKDLGELFLKYVGKGDLIKLLPETRNAEEQRMKLYLRTLKNKFPDLQDIKIDEHNRIIVYLGNKH